MERSGIERKQLSRTAYGSVIHAALLILERTKDLEAALDTFRYYWHPLHIDAICEPVTVWQVRDSYNSMLVKGLQTIRQYASLKPWDDVETLALEYSFTVPVPGTKDPDTGGPLLLAGTIDKLAVGMHRRTPILLLDDFKSGQRPKYLRHNMQGTVYAYASTCVEFWTGWPEHHTEGFGEERGMELYKRFREKARKFRWIDLRQFEFIDAGFRGPQDFERMKYAIQQVANAIHHDVYPLSMTGEICEWCSVRDHCADGIGLSDSSGVPEVGLR